MDDPRTLSDAQLLAKLDRFVVEERARLPDFIACLGVADQRKLPQEQGYSSTFDYCVRRLMLSEDEAYRRIQAARAAADRPELLAALAAGRLTLTAISRIAPHARRADAPEIIARSEGKTAREIDELLAPLTPEKAKRDRIRTISVVAADGDGETAPAAEVRVDFSFQGPRELRDAIERAEELLAHKLPFGGVGGVLLEVVNDYLARHDPQRALDFGRAAPARGRSAIPAAIRRAVWARDGGRCVFVGQDGIRCGSRRMLELDHRLPRSRGGLGTFENLRLLCRAHNDAERRRVLGEGDLSTGLVQDESEDNSPRRAG